VPGSRFWFMVTDTVDTAAKPRATPICCAELSRAEAMPESWDRTPATAVRVSGTKLSANSTAVAKGQQVEGPHRPDGEQQHAQVGAGAVAIFEQPQRQHGVGAADFDHQEQRQEDDCGGEQAQREALELTSVTYWA
jgi:hypothetical protein